MPGPIGRLGSLRNPAPKRPRVPGKQQSQKKCCPDPLPKKEDGVTICQHCYTQIAEENIVSEVTFEESSGGRATVQGGTVSDGSRHAKTLGPGAHRRGIGGERNSFADIQATGRRALQQLCPKLHIDNNVSIQAESIWALAANINFSAGRRTDEVVAACLYAACRRQRDNPILLMDIAELLKINVFRLGEVYKDLCKALYLRDESVGQQFMQELEPLIKKYCDKLQFADKTREVAQDALRIIRRMNRDWIVDGRHPAGLCGACIILAARMNNFRRSVREVVYVAKIADITIAKRIEEFRRTKSAGLTVNEFREYALKIKHQHDPPALLESQLKHERMERRRQNRQNHLQYLARQSEARESQPIEIPDDATDASSRLSSLEPGTPFPDDSILQDMERVSHQRTIVPPTPPMTQEQLQQQQQENLAAALQFDAQQNTQPPSRNTAKRASPTAPEEEEPRKRQRTATPQATSSQPTTRFDADGFAIPALPLTTELEIEEPPKKRRGRPRKEHDPPPVVITEEELAAENWLEIEIEACMDASEVQDSRLDVENKKEEERLEMENRAKQVAEEQKALEARKMKSQREATGTSEFWNPSTSEYPSAEELEKEFENDPEVMNCELSAAEVRIKEQIWVTHNEDWLRRQAEREMLAKVARATGQTKKGKKGKESKRKKRSKMGDGTVLTETSTPIETPADAARAMLEKRAPQKSLFVDFSALQRIYGRETPSRASSTTPGGSGDQTRDGTPAGSTPAASREPSIAPTESAVGGAESLVADDDDDDVEENDEEAEEEITLPRPQPQPATFENTDMNDEPEPDDDDEDDFEMAVGETDEFGFVDDGGFEGEDYESYD